MREPDDLLGRDPRGLIDDVDAALLEDLTETASCAIAIVNGTPVHLRERRRVQVLRVVAHGEDRRLRLADPLALEEVAVEAGRVEHARLRQRLGARRAGRVAARSPAR